MKKAYFDTCKNYQHDTVQCQGCLSHNGCLDYVGAELEIVFKEYKECVVTDCSSNAWDKCYYKNRPIRFNQVVKLIEECPCGQ